MNPTLAALHLYPIKSCAALSPTVADVMPRGLAHDRRWLIVDANGKFVTGRQLARMPLLRAEPSAHGLQLRAPGMPDIAVATPAIDAARREVEVWGTRIDAACADSDANAWISTFLQQPLQLVHMDQQARRAVDPAYGRAEDEVSFADAFPLLAISQAALDQLNTRLPQPVSMLRFRPNLVIADSAAHAEDRWKRIRIGAIEFDVVKPCTRCVFTTVDPLRGERDADGEPLKTLTRYRRTPTGVTFGQNLIARGQGRIAVGDSIVVLE